jgi:hypothetical protein
VYFAGALQHAPQRVLALAGQGRKYQPKFADDLEMVVRSVFHSLSMTAFEEIRLEQNAAKIMGFWEKHMKPPVWATMLATAQEEDYDGLKQRICDVLPLNEG